MGAEEGGGWVAAEGFTNFSLPSNFFRKYFMAPPINFGFLFKAYL